ncbi:uncharacterized protein [Choristoneura fumiferana]|uniref:uncharacterized protein n=1 Tax=Choristoneura fumiferana TaxID=7141 RepID=UPI003D158855
MEEILEKRVELRKLSLETLIASAKHEYESNQMEYDRAKRLVKQLLDLVNKLDVEIKEYTMKLPTPKLDIVSPALAIQLQAESLCSEIEDSLSSVQHAIEEKGGASATTRLPKLELPSYSGDCLKWTEFWDRFRASIHERNIADSEKMAYLLGSLSGLAKESVSGLGVTDNNYIIAIDTLKNRFGSKDALIDAHYTQLNNLQRAEYNSTSCRSTLNEIERHLRILENLGEPVNGNYFRAMILRKFPDKVVHEHHLSEATEGTTLTAIRKNLNKIITAMEKSSSMITDTDASLLKAGPVVATAEALHIRTQKGNFKRFQHTQWRPDRKRKLEPVSTAPAAKKSRRSCIFCGLSNHASKDCRKFSTVEARKTQLNGRCLNCLGKNHKTEECRKNVTCFRCGEKGHVQWLCLKAKGEEDEREMKIPEMICNMTHGLTFLQTAVVQLQNPQVDNKLTDGRVLLDSGSQRSYITKELADALGLPIISMDQLVIYTFGSPSPQETTSPCTTVTILTKRGIRSTIQVNIVPHITDRVPIAKLDYSQVDLHADDDSVGEKIDLLIGNDFYCSFMRNDKIEISNNLYLIDTDFGYILSGNVYIEDNDEVLSVTTYCQCHTQGCPYFSEPDLPLRYVDIKFLWSLENLGITDSPKTTRQEEAVHQFNASVQYKQNRYEVKWPWIQHPPELVSNFGLAMGRLKSLMRRLDKESLNEYNEILKEQLQLGIIEVVESQADTEPDHPIHYLPHHMVKQVGKKGRIVYDASAKTSGNRSLNECLYSGPYMLESLTSLLIKFRTKSIAMTADVEKAFLQVGLQEEDRDVTRFLWLKDINQELRDDNLICLRFCRVPFGVIASPFLLTATIKHHMNQSKDEQIKSIAEKCYVDNLVIGADSIQEAQDIYNKTRMAFQQMSMNIRDWVSNNQEFMHSIPKQLQANQTNEVKVLGLLWNVNRDTLTLNITEDHLNPVSPVDTKRKLLRTLARIYDPCGFVCPLILPMKLLFQDICNQKFKWDTVLPAEILQTLKGILENWKASIKVEVPRQLGKLTSDSDTEYELHGFADASKSAFASVVFIRMSGPQGTSISFVMGKSHVTQNKDKENINIPRQELLGFLITSRLVKYIRTNIDLPIRREYLWTDSLVILGWMRSNKLLPPFVTNRVKEIKGNVPEAKMYYIHTKVNPADVATRPETWQEKRELWFNGPEFLQYDETKWPESRYYENHHNTVLSVGEDPDQNPGEDPLGMKDISDTAQFSDQIMELDELESTSQDIDMASMDETMDEIRRIQREHFPEELSGKKTHLTRNLDLFMDENGLLRSRGRMANTSWSYEMKYPILLPKESEFTNNVIKETHESNYHVGAPHTLSIIRKKYWIPQGKAQVQKVIRRCSVCIKHGGGPYKLPPTPALPAERVTYTTPFSYTGVDYFGPLFVSSPNGKAKRWIALFTCLTVRAIHLEVVNDLTAEECLLAIRRFSASRNTPKKIYSDNATYFKLTSEIIEKPYCVKNKISWKFIPQLAPWHGGFYERLVALVKHCLKRTLDKHLINDSQLHTIMKEVEAVVNSRPLTKIGPDVEHILRPADFLSLGTCLTTETSHAELPSVGTKAKTDLITSWKRGLKILEEIKQMFIGQYLVSLRERFRSEPKQPRVISHKAPEIGDLVQIKAESKNRINWKVGKIVDMRESTDGKCRVAEVKVDGSILTRSIGHLYPLEVESDPIPDDDTSERVRNKDQETAFNESAHDSVTSSRPTPQESETVDPVELAEPEVEESASAMDDGTPMEMSGSLDIHGQDLVAGKERRAAAVRAREKILEWTRHLLTILE